MEIQKEIEFEEIEELQGTNTVVIFSNGVIKKVDLPEFGMIEITTTGDKATYLRLHVGEKL